MPLALVVIIVVVLRIPFAVRLAMLALPTKAPAHTVQPRLPCHIELVAHVVVSKVCCMRPDEGKGGVLGG